MSDYNIEPMVVVDREMLIPQGQRFLLEERMFRTDSKGRPIPSLKVSEVSKIFFGQSDDWLRWRMRSDTTFEIDPETGKEIEVEGNWPHGFFVLDGKPLVFRRTPSNARYFSLADVERMAHALAQQGAISGGKMSHVLTMVKACAEMYGVI